jgi:hypothetical protein
MRGALVYCEGGDGRVRRKKQHGALLQKYIRMTGITVWKQQRYCFDFGNKAYVAGGEKMRVTPAEELYLYERLVLRKRPKDTTCRYAVQRLRERYGPGFLAGYIQRSWSNGAEADKRREAFGKALREYIEKDGRAGYKERGYDFDFLNGCYMWDGEELRVTPKEAVFLYERLVLRLRGRRGAYRRTEGGTLCNVRKKFGEKFLRDAFAKGGAATE